jgi:hypothetical protein
MVSPLAERAITEATRVGRAVLKFISPNDVGLTGSHQGGYYLPKSEWEMFSEHPPERGKNAETEVKILWQDGQVTDSRVKWYGAAKSEYRLTRFGKDFPFITQDCVGNLLVLIPEDYQHFLAFVLDLEEDIEEVQAALDVEITQSWAAYRREVPAVAIAIAEETEEECIEKRFRKFAEAITAFPTGAIFSEATRQALLECIKDFEKFLADETLMRCVDAEYRLFRLVERQLCMAEITRLFKDVDDFIGTAATIMNRRKSRAGRSFENHVEYVLTRAKIPHQMRPDIDGKPDVIIPSVEAYNDTKYPVNKLVMLGLKTTCKDRWPQVLKEAMRVPQKHILTLQQGIAPSQLNEMHGNKVQLIVPKKIHHQYPTKDVAMKLLTVEDFINNIQTTLQ